MGGILHLLLTIALGGAITWLITLIPMPQIFRTIIIAIATIALVVLTLQFLGVNTGPLPHLSLL